MTKTNRKMKYVYMGFYGLALTLSRVAKMLIVIDKKINSRKENKS